MPKRPSRSARRRRGRRPPAVAPSRPASAAPHGEATADGAAPLSPAPRPARPASSREPSLTRMSWRDYSYVRRDVQRILILATAVIVTIIVLSFFIP